MIGREAANDDRTSIENFCCTGALAGHEFDVEVAVRRSFAWWRFRDENQLHIFEHEGEIIAVAGYRPIFATHPRYGVFIEFLAVDLTRQDVQTGTLLFAELADEVAPTIAPGGWLVWHVHEENTRCLHISDKIGERRTVIATPPKYISFVTGIPEATRLIV